MKSAADRIAEANEPRPGDFAGKGVVTRRDDRPRLRIEVGRFSAWVRGRGVRDLIDRAGCRRMYDPVQCCWSMPAASANDLAALVEHMGGSASVVAVAR